MRRQKMTAIAALGMTMVFLPPGGAYAQSAPAETGEVEPTGLMEGMYLDLAAHYLIIPEGIEGIFYKVSSTLPGGRLGAGNLLRLGPGSLGLGLEFGYNRVAVDLGSEMRDTNFLSVQFKADYRIPINRHGLSVRFGVGAGILLDPEPVTTKFMDTVVSGRVYLQWAFIPKLAVYLGAAGDMLLETEGPVLTPGVELGLRWMPFAVRR